MAGSQKVTGSSPVGSIASISRGDVENQLSTYAPQARFGSARFAGVDPASALCDRHDNCATAPSVSARATRLGVTKMRHTWRWRVIFPGRHEERRAHVQTDDHSRSRRGWGRLMSPISRGFRGRRSDEAEAGRVPPGQYVTQDFPVLSAGPTPHHADRVVELRRSAARSTSRSRGRGRSSRRCRTSASRSTSTA